MSYRSYAAKHFQIKKEKAQGPNIAKFILQNSVWLALISGFLEVERINKSYDGAEIWKM